MSTNTYQLAIGDLKIDVVRKGIKNLHLGVYPPNGRVRIASPLRINDDAVRLFAISKLGWIKKQQRKFDNQERQPAREYVSGESHYYKGMRYLLTVIFRNGPAKVEMRNKTYIDLYVKPGTLRNGRARVMTKWYREQLNEILPGIIEKAQKLVGVKVNECNVKRMKTKWGTCNTKAKRIWLNLELIKKPPHCLDFIIVHEMVHFLERLHSPRFIELMNKFLPQWRAYKVELNQSILSYADWGY